MSEKSDKSNISNKDTPGKTDPIQTAINDGIDVSMLADNLQRSVTERIRRHQIALNTANKLRNAKRL